MDLKRFTMRILGMRIFDVLSISRTIKLYGYRKLLHLDNIVNIHSHVMIYPHHPQPKGFKKLNQTGVIIGKNCKIEDNVNIDSTGNVIIGDNVRFALEVLIFTHSHNYHSNPNLPPSDVTATTLEINEGVVIGARAIILSSCHHIGKNARIGAGAVVTKDIPDNAIAVGTPAKVVKMLEL